VGEKLAEKLGVSFYDKAVIMGLEEKYHLTVDEIEKMRNKKHHWWSDFKLVTGIGEGLVSSSRLISEVGKEPDVLTTETMFKAESEILEDIANVESCVIAGRSGFYVFRNHPNHLRVMIQASLPFRIKRLVRKKGITEEEARKIIEKVDKMRENYVKKFTGTTRYDTRNYDIVISADGKTEDQIVDQILLYIEQ
jgi:cytidylate kinase